MTECDENAAMKVRDENQARAGNTAHNEEGYGEKKTILTFLGFAAVLTFAGVGWSGYNRMTEDKENMERDLRTCRGNIQPPNPLTFPPLDHLNQEYCVPLSNITLSKSVKYSWKRHDTEWKKENYQRSRREIEVTNNHSAHEQPAFQGRIINGDLAHIKQYPFYTALWLNGVHMCGASILTKDMILTAAHCVHTIVNPGKLEAYFGISTKEEVMNKKTEGYDMHHSKVKTIILNPNWNKATFEGDNAILELETPIPEWSDYIMPACIHHKDLVNVEGPDLKSGMEVEVLGMGVEEEGSTASSDYLESVAIAMISNKDCDKYFKDDWMYPDMICAGHLLGGKDACQGDSGGPLVQTALVEGTPIEWLVGVVSFGLGCARPGLGGAYSSVAHYSQWIADTVNHFKMNYQ